jgi:hypothetical protein
MGSALVNSAFGLLSLARSVLPIASKAESGNLLAGHVPLVAGSTHRVQFSCLFAAMNRLHGDAQFRDRFLWRKQTCVLRVSRVRGEVYFVKLFGSSLLLPAGGGRLRTRSLSGATKRYPTPGSVSK